jgi:hypothetical protein
MIHLINEVSGRIEIYVRYGCWEKGDEVCLIRPVERCGTFEVLWIVRREDFMSVIADCPGNTAEREGRGRSAWRSIVVGNVRWRG